MIHVPLSKMNFMYAYIFNTNCVECGTSIFVRKLSRDLVERKYILVIFVESILLGYPCSIINIFVEMHLLQNIIEIVSAYFWKDILVTLHAVKFSIQIEQMITARITSTT